MQTPATRYARSLKPYQGLPELTYPLQPLARSRCLGHRLWPHLQAPQAHQLSHVLAGQRVGIKELDEGIWIADFMHYDLGCIDWKQNTLQSLDNPFGARLLPMS